MKNLTLVPKLETVLNEKPALTPKKVSKGKDDNIGKAIDAFLANETGKFDKYYAVKNALVYRTLSYKDGETTVLQDVIALRMSNGTVIGNSSILPLIGRTVNWGNENRNRTVTEIQTRLSQLIVMIPFTVFLEANLNLNKFEILERGNEEDVTRKIPNPKYSDYDKKKQDVPKWIDETVHFTGASLFKVEDKIFLFDIDRREIEHKIFNPFLAQIPAQVDNIKDAYLSLKPKEVLDAESQGLKVLRQGEWFFIPVKGNYEAVKAAANRWDKKEFEPVKLQAGQNRANTVSKYSRIDKNNIVVSGQVEHDGREHAKLILGDVWYRAVPNTSIRSFTITGDVD